MDYSKFLKKSLNYIKIFDTNLLIFILLETH